MASAGTKNLPKAAVRHVDMELARVRRGEAQGLQAQEPQLPQAQLRGLRLFGGRGAEEICNAHVAPREGTCGQGKSTSDPNSALRGEQQLLYEVAVIDLVKV